jgi:hypothetical protein
MSYRCIAPPPILYCKETDLNAALYEPVVFKIPADRPRAVLLIPDVLFARTARPIAVLRHQYRIQTIYPDCGAVLLR